MNLLRLNGFNWSNNLFRMKKVFYFMGLVWAGLATTAVAQDNPCGVEGVVVEASSFMYTPSALEIEAGQTVVWVNVDGFHDVNGVTSTIGDVWNNPETFSTSAVSGNAEGVCLGSHTFTLEGVYNYDCSIGSHAANGMVATITVNPAPPAVTVVDIIVNSDDHTLLEAAVIEAGLVDALNGDGPFTVFAPNDAAVVALTEALQITAEELLALPNLGEILQYHVVGAAAYSTDLTDGQMIETLLGEDVTVSITAEGVMINNAMVIVADIAADNGVVHVIDAVLLPPTPNSIDEEASMGMEIFPNPVQAGVLNIQGDWSAGSSLQVWDATGRLMMETTLNTSNATVTVEAWKAGTYIVRVTEATRSIQKMFLVN